MDERLVEINTSIFTITGRVNDMDKHIEDPKSKEDTEELHAEM